MKWLKSNKYVAWLLVIIWFLVIYYFSSKDATDSSAMSSGVILFIKQLLSFVNDNHFMQLLVRKSAHIIEFAILFILMHHACFLTFRHVEITSLSFTLFMACFDEFHQLFIPGRSGQIKDICIDMIGVIILFVLYRYKELKN